MGLTKAQRAADKALKEAGKPVDNLPKPNEPATDPEESETLDPESAEEEIDELEAQRAARIRENAQAELDQLKERSKANTPGVDSPAVEPEADQAEETPDEESLIEDMERTIRIRKSASRELMEMKLDSVLRVVKAVKETQEAQPDRRNK
ncbi:hypothetical protein GCM10028803_05110 [Larkinella knui]|uniref:Uncharacterized protein n=1 Tax=Larkinella knui TaxID=2025310 RepID=A0A3P1CKF0_9BACT|nr:hypothetical protein [Larkinella knui]RRB13812.1 hypothetical protein EHT87_16265 [Larkinella knui]